MVIEPLYIASIRFELRITEARDFYAELCRYSTCNIGGCCGDTTAKVRESLKHSLANLQLYEEVSDGSNA